jgi:hypothetical protein
MWLELLLELSLKIPPLDRGYAAKSRLEIWLNQESTSSLGNARKSGFRKCPKHGDSLPHHTSVHVCLQGGIFPRFMVHLIIQARSSKETATYRYKNLCYSSLMDFSCVIWLELSDPFRLLLVLVGTTGTRLLLL